ncbi:glycosyltransferase [uncultured Desulfosarcina sp.]|uniref:glycosyltransferase n=1 Tax=uncultured Desulfosarcina sp. TaxID=218289 RepID=UPI0029C62FA0|nr:glycosyltransferase [uncultured Desulfosarcina sp.]
MFYEQNKENKRNRPKSSDILLSIAIPTYNRSKQLKYGLNRFLSQITDDIKPLIEICVADDCSTDDTPAVMKRIVRDNFFIHYERYEYNIGLEKNLIACTQNCRGKYLWIFGDDDFLEFDDSLACIISLLKEGCYPFYILNRTRRSFDLSKKISENWMGLDFSNNKIYPRLRDFCSKWGIISIIGFISVNIFEREKFTAVIPDKYWGIMYPQLGMMLEAFANHPCLLVTRPLICHRTQTQEEKRAALGEKSTEKDFMSNYQRRNAIYFSFRLIRFINALIDCGAISYNELKTMREFTFSNILLIEFILKNIELSVLLKLGDDTRDWQMALTFYKHMFLKDKYRGIYLYRLIRNLKLDRGDLEGAIKIGEKILISFHEKQDYEAFYRIAVESQKKMKFALAHTAYIRIANDKYAGYELHAWALFKSGELALENGNEEEASNYFKSALRRNPNHTKASIFTTSHDKKLKVFISPDSSYAEDDCIPVKMELTNEELWSYYFSYRFPDYVAFYLDEHFQEENISKLLNLVVNHIAPDGAVNINIYNKDLFSFYFEKIKKLSIILKLHVNACDRKEWIYIKKKMRKNFL